MNIFIFHLSKYNALSCSSCSIFPDYMQGSYCGEKQVLDGATVYSHLGASGEGNYADNIECRITFRAENENLKLMLRVLDLDIPDTSYNELCNDALYVYDAKNIMGRPVVSNKLYFTFYVCF